ncbi:unnamed protein product [Brachionus calyciflorus]|uniref:MULE transposase domain-containing protein n=1 Tax=Brachionus calyciflorus TaxID=104777 RepID=A0A814JFK1_9BILA|nr:unnamed protein product [Brachionus calyciflorus]
MEGVVEYLETLTNKVNTDDDLVVFGVKKENGLYKVGSGSDDDHCHFGLTSKKLIKNLVDGTIFHIDATYKIVKYCYPVIVFGFTDIARKFHPIAFMITTHETQSRDYGS